MKTVPFIRTIKSHCFFRIYFFSSKSKYTFPVHNITRFTFFGSVAVSGSTSLNRPEVNSAIGETTFGCLNKDLGDMTTQGFLNSQVSCLLSKWKKLEGSVILATTMLYSAESCKNRSGLALECSGPWPSYP